MKRTCALTSSRQPRGFTLIGLVTTLAVLAIVVMVVSSQLRNTTRTQAHIDSSEGILSVRDYVLSQMSCEATITDLPASCLGPSPTGFVTVYGKSAQVLIQQPANNEYSTLGQDFYLRAQCVACPNCVAGRALRIEFTRGWAADQANPDALTKVTDQWRDLFNEIPVGCTLQ